MSALRAVAALLSVAVFAGCGWAQVREAPASAAAVQLSFAPVVKQVSPGVVNIYARQTSRARPAFFDDPLFERFFGGGGRIMPRERVQQSLGSGVVVRPEGVIVTNNHVVASASDIVVVLADRREFSARVLIADERTDLAVLKIDAGETLPAVPLGDSDMVQVGDLVLAIGNPFGVGQTVTSGIVSAVARTRTGISDYGFFIQTDAAINPGNSGGALVNMRGELIGINTAIFSRTGGSIGIGFAIPTAMVRTVVGSALAGGTRVVRPWFGATGEPVTAEIASAIGLPRPEGVILREVAPGGPAAAAGLRTGDVVVRVGDFEIADPEALRFRIATQTAGAAVTVAYVRDGQSATAQVTVAAPPETPARDQTTMRGRNPLAGATIANLNPAFADEIGISTSLSGVIVTGVDPRSPAARVGFQPGDILVAINGTQIGSVREAQAAVSVRTDRWEIAIRRNGQLLEVALRG